MHGRWRRRRVVGRDGVGRVTAAQVGAPPGSTSSAGRVGRRRAGPGGRAVAGGVFVALAVVLVAVVVGTGTGARGRSWVVASRDLPAGAQLGPQDLTTESLSLPAAGVGATAYRSAAPLVGEVLVAPLRAGELVQASDVAAGSAAARLRPVTVPVAPSDLADLADGTLVDVLVTDGTDPSAPTTVVAAGAHVLGLGRSSGGLVGASSGATVTLGVASLDEVAAVVHAAHTGTLSVVVGAPGDRVGTVVGGAPAAAAGSPPAGSTPGVTGAGG